MAWLDGISWIEWGGMNSIDYGLVAKKLPVFRVAKERVERVEIPGRDGELHIADGSYESYETDCILTMTDDTRLSEIFAWLRGSADLSTSDDPDRIVHARVISEIDPKRIVSGVKDFPVAFKVQPFRYEKSPESVSLTASGVINNPGTASSYPIIVVTGTGTLTIDSDAFVIIESGVTINSQIEECYAGAVSKNDKVSGGFPVLTPGLHTITLGAGITAVLIQINARWY
jgi:phage-related protein